MNSNLESLLALLIASHTHSEFALFRNAPGEWDAIIYEPYALYASGSSAHEAVANLIDMLQAKSRKIH